MNAIETLNHWGARLLDFALPMLAQSSVLIVALFALDLVLRNRVRAVIRYALWMLVLIKLVLPPSFAAPTGLAYWLPEKKAAQAKPAITPQFVVRYSDIQFDAAPVLPSLSPPPPRLQFAAWLLLSWLGITVGLLTLLARRSHLISTITRRAVPAPASPEQLLDDCRAQMKIKRRVRLRLSRHASSPAVYGLWRPVVLIPQQLADKLSALQLRAVLLHELAHIKRGDVWVHHAQTLLQILYWWHPLLWLANTRIRRVREQAVDEMVMVQMGVEAEAYPATLLEVAKLAFKRPMLALGLIGIVESKSALAQRIHRLVNHPVPRSSRLGLAGLAPLLLAGAAFLPMARGQRTLSQPPPIASESAPVVAMDVRFIEIEERPLATLGLGEPPLIEPNGHRAWVLTSEQLNEVCQRAVEQAGTDVLTAPRVTTVSGRQTQVQVVDIIPVAGTEIRVGPTCDLTPYVTGDLIDLAVATSVTERRPVDPAAPFTSVTEAFLTNDVGTARVIVEDGGGVVLENPEARSSKGNRYLVMVSATLASADHTSESQTPDQASVAPPASMRAAARTQEVPAAITGNPTQPRPANSPNNRPAEPVTVSQGATTRFESSTGHEVVIEAIRPAEIQYDYESGTCVVTNDFVARFKDAVLTARRGQINSKTGEVIADGDVILQRGDQVLRCERLEYNFIHQKITGTSTSSGAASSSAPARSQVENNVVPMPPANGAQDQPADAATKGDASEFESEQLTVTIAKTEPHLYFRSEPVTVEELKTRLQRAADRNPAATLSLQADTDAPFGEIVKVMDVAKEAGIKSISASVPPQESTAATLETAKQLFELGQFDAVEEKLRDLLKTDPENPAAKYYLGLVQESRAETERRRAKPGLWHPTIPPRPAGSPSNQPGSTVKASDGSTPPSGPRADKVPVLGDLPLVGPLFRSASTTNSLHVVTSPKASQEPKLITQFFRINPQSFLEALRRQMPDTGSTNMDMVRRFFEGAGVNPNPPNMVFFKDRTGILMVRATAEELDLVQKAIAALNIAPPQSPAESKSVEVGPNDTKKLGFDWFLGNTLLSNGQLGSQGGTAPPQEDKTKPVSSPTPLETRSFRVDPHRLRESLQKQLAGDLSTNVVESVRRFFEGAGVNVFSPNTIYYDERTGLLMVRATKEEFETVEKALAILNYSPAQITIESRLMEMPTDTAGILGLDLPPPNSTTNTWKRVLTAAQMQALLRAAEQSSAMGILIAPKILPAPKVTTLSGRQTQIQVMDNGMTTRIKPQALAQPGVQPTNGATSPFTMSAIPPGSVLNLVPEVDSDGYTIHVTASISVMRARGEGKHAHLPLPILLIRQMQAEADVYNGQTLVLGNPNGESVTERTPEESEKQLLVFITPTIIDPAGNPIHPPGKEPFSTDKVPPQSR